MSLHSDIAKWDGKTTSDISAVYVRYQNHGSMLEELIEYLDDPLVQKGATWLLKRHIESTEPLSTKSTKDILGKLSSLTHWESRLHLLQCIPHLSIPEVRKNRVESFLRRCLLADNKFVRAWAYGGFYELARQYPAYRQEAEQFMEMAMRDEPASVRARVRKVSSEGF